MTTDATDDTQTIQQTPQPPRIDRRLLIHRAGVVGLVLMFGIPLLSIAGVFGPRSTRVERAVGPLQVQLEFPQRMRREQVALLQLHLRNTSATPLQNVSYELADAYWLFTPCC